MNNALGARLVWSPDAAGSTARSRVSAVDVDPLVTVVMPVRNEQHFIERSLGAVLAQDYPPHRLEVVIADGMSTDRTREVIARTAGGRPAIDVQVCDNAGGIVSCGLNRAFARARGDIIVRVDGHTLIAPDYVRQCVAALQRSGAENVGGRMDAVSERTFGRSVSLATSSPFGVGDARFHFSTREELVDTVYMGAWPRRVFNEIGLFDEELIRDQDDEFNYRLREYGGRVLLSPLINSRYYPRTTPRTLWRQYFDYGFWKVRVMQKHPRQMRWRHFVPPVFVAALLLLLGTSPVSATSARLLAVIAGAYAAASFGASIQAATPGHWRLIGMLPLTFGILHAAYGLGFLSGLVRFSGEWRRRTGDCSGIPRPTSDKPTAADTEDHRKNPVPTQYSDNDTERVR
jgi:succinoglycan biosynthesis protein ExoA